MNAQPDKPASLANARALRHALREAGFELRLTADEQLTIDPPDPDVLAGARPWLRRYRAQLTDLLRIDALLAGAIGDGDAPADDSPGD